MWVRISKVKRKGKVYEYAQLVESFRRKKDGAPSTKVLASLGRLDRQTIENLRTAMAAAKNNKAVVIRGGGTPLLGMKPVIANLRYLDIMVMASMWDYWGLSELLEGLLPKRESDVSVSELVKMLAIHRSVDPGSKLHSSRWFPTTALPEVTGILPGQCNNTRLHRVLEDLDTVEEELQSKLSLVLQAKEEPLVTMFLDMTDTWFAGRGPDLAERAKTKEGFFKNKIGIVLLCNERGYPLRWKVVKGKHYEAHIMYDLIKSIDSTGWATSAPLVCDRAMGRKGMIEKLLERNVKFVTATPRNEYESYTDKIPDNMISTVELGLSDDTYQEDIRLLCRAAMDAGMVSMSADKPLFVMELGLLRKNAHDVMDPAGACKRISEQEDVPTAIAALELGLELKREMDDDPTMTYRRLQEKYGLTQHYVLRSLAMTKLSGDIQGSILAGLGACLSKKDLLMLSKIRDPQKQREAFDELVKKKDGKRKKWTHAQVAGGGNRRKLDKALGEVRGVLYFSPELHLDLKRLDEERLQAVYTFVREYNEQLKAKNTRYTKMGVLGAVGRKLGTHNLREAFEVLINETEHCNRKCFEVELRLIKREWFKRGRYNGFMLLLAHPELPYGAKEIVKLYKAKDTVEKDFQIIKSQVKLRPVRHRTDAKVRAHVTICMLSLLLERTLERQLKLSSTSASASSALETLSTCHLNILRVAGDTIPMYSITECTSDQLALLRALSCQRLADDTKVAEMIRIHRS